MREITADYYNETERGKQSLSYDHLNNIIIYKIYLIFDNQSDFKQISNLKHFLFNYNDN